MYYKDNPEWGKILREEVAVYPINIRCPSCYGLVGFGYFGEPYKRICPYCETSLWLKDQPQTISDIILSED